MLKWIASSRLLRTSYIKYPHHKQILRMSQKKNKLKRTKISLAISRQQKKKSTKRPKISMPTLTGIFSMLRKININNYLSQTTLLIWQQTHLWRSLILILLSKRKNKLQPNKQWVISPNSKKQRKKRKRNSLLAGYNKLTRNQNREVANFRMRGTLLRKRA